MNVEHMVDSGSRISYRRWIVRMAYYERTLGHRFFYGRSITYNPFKLQISWCQTIFFLVKGNNNPY
jgi:hypothetical protein